MHNFFHTILRQIRSKSANHNKNKDRKIHHVYSFFPYWLAPKAQQVKYELCRNDRQYKQTKTSELPNHKIQIADLVLLQHYSSWSDDWTSKPALLIACIYCLCWQWLWNLCGRAGQHLTHSFCYYFYYN